MIRLIKKLITQAKWVGASLSEVWMKVPEKWRLEIISVGHTMTAAVFVEASMFLAQYNYLPPWDKTVAIALCFALVRSAIKAGLTFVFAKKS